MSDRRFGWKRVAIPAGHAAGSGISRQLLLITVTLSLMLASCSLTGSDDSEAPDVLIAVTAGNFSSTVRPDRTTDVPFQDVMVFDVEFEYEVIGAAGQTAVRVETDPSTYRVEPTTPRDRQTYSFAMFSPRPGEVDVEIYENAEATPVSFTLAIGTEDE
ncbi:MAG: hypothetical protein ACOC9Y_06895 [Chloroflexota bacterium]